MKLNLRSKLLTACTLLSVSAFSQVINSTEVLPFGSTYTLKGISNLSVIDTTIQGQNVTWNFAALTPSSSILNVTVMDPNDTPYGAFVSNTNYAFKESPTTAYRYFNVTSAKMERVGSYSGSTLKTYSDPQIEYTFPMQYNSTNVDTWNNSSSSTGGTYAFTVIGSGTLILPNGSHEAILTRVHLEEGFNELDAYYWYDGSNGSILAFVINPGIFTSYQGSYQTSLIQSTAGEEEFDVIMSAVYQNPVQEKLYVSVKNFTGGDLNYTIFDLNGKFISSGKAQNDPDDTSIIDTNVSELSKGIYLLTIISENNSGSKTIRFTKE
ncbi:T9SS type A sorting domain-containing protein [Fluviicola sp.]|uniref:T9SS type A sorting domain-containing protein n=1 Tax=Fluviicola sp. TaxID=1917219 RepID=UPI0031CF923A